VNGVDGRVLSKECRKHCIYTRDKPEALRECTPILKATLRALVWLTRQLAQRSKFPPSIMNMPWEGAFSLPH
jgi:hypothetical protein